MYVDFVGSFLGCKVKLTTLCSRRHVTSDLWQLSNAPHRMQVQQTESKARYVALIRKKARDPLYPSNLTAFTGPPKKSQHASRRASMFAVDAFQPQTTREPTSVDPSFETSLEWALDFETSALDCPTLPVTAIDAASEFTSDTARYLSVLDLTYEMMHMNG